MEIRQRNIQNIKMQIIKKFSKTKGGIEYTDTKDTPYIRTHHIYHSEMHPN